MRTFLIGPLIAGCILLVLKFISSLYKVSATGTTLHVRGLLQSVDIPVMEITQMRPDYKRMKISEGYYGFGIQVEYKNRWYSLSEPRFMVLLFGKTYDEAELANALLHINPHIILHEDLQRFLESGQYHDLLKKRLYVSTLGWFLIIVTFAGLIMYLHFAS